MMKIQEVCLPPEFFIFEIVLQYLTNFDLQLNLNKIIVKY
jgi:hypothetical protein